MEVSSRLRTIAGTFLVTSLMWVAGVTWWWSRSSEPPPVTVALQAAMPAEPERTTPVQGTVTAAAPVDHGGLIIPVQGVRPEQLTDTFTQARANGARVHDAIDILAPRGTPVLAAADGTVEKLFTSVPGGLTIYVRPRDRHFIHYYAHLDHYAPGLHEGQQVRQGEIIGAVGFTGNASPSAPHLHFAIQVTTPEAKWYEPSTAINPYPLLTGR